MITSCNKNENKEDQSFTLISKDDFFVEYGSYEIYKDAKTKKVLNGYYVIGNGLVKWEEFNVENGVLNGIYLFYHNNGNISIKSNYVKGKLQGEEIYYYPSGAIQQKHSYKNGVILGLQTHYYEGGQKKTESKYINGKSNESTSYDLVGNITSQSFLKDGLSIRQQIRNGKLISETISSTYDDYEAMKFYNEDGSLKHHLRMIENNEIPIIIELDDKGNEIKRLNIKENPQKAIEYMPF